MGAVFGSNRTNTVCIDTNSNLVPQTGIINGGSFVAPNIGTTTATSGLQLPGSVLQFTVEITARDPGVSFSGNSIKFLKNSVNSLAGASEVASTGGIAFVGDSETVQVTGSTAGTFWFITLAPTFGTPGFTITVAISYQSFTNINDTFPGFTQIVFNENSPNVWSTPVAPTLSLNSDGVAQGIPPTFAYKATNVTGALNPNGPGGSDGYPFPDGIEPMWPTTTLRNGGQIAYFRYHQTFVGDEFAAATGTVLWTSWFSALGFLRTCGVASFRLNSFSPSPTADPPELYAFFKLRAVAGDNVIQFGVGGNAIVGMSPGEMAFATVQFEVISTGSRSFAQVIG